MHENMGDGPTRPTRDAEGFDPGDYPNLTPPDLSCLTAEEAVASAAAGSGVITAIASRSTTLLFKAMDELVELKAHVVGHTLQCLVWSGYQIAMLNSGMEPRDDGGLMVMIASPKDEQTEADVAALEMVNEFVRATLAGAHQSAMDIWGRWVSSLADSEWMAYKMGVGVLVDTGIKMAVSRFVEDEAASAVLGGRAVRMVPACGHDHDEE